MRDEYKPSQRPEEDRGLRGGRSAHRSGCQCMAELMNCDRDEQDWPKKNKPQQRNRRSLRDSRETLANEDDEKEEM